MCGTAKAELSAAARLNWAGEPLLPVEPASLDKVVIVGDLAGKVTLGGYSGEPSSQVNAVEGITAQAREADPDVRVVYDEAGTSTTSTDDAELGAQTRSDIEDADLVVIAVGTDDAVAAEGLDHANLRLSDSYASLIDQVTALGNPRTVLDIQADAPLTIEDVRDKVPAIVFSGYNGQSQGDALTDALFGSRNPSGHLNFTWYKNDAQLPDISDYGLTPGDTDGLGRTYQHFTGTPSYPFGYGLSYSTFSYSRIRADRGSVSADGTVKVGFDVTNTGSVPGATVAQLYAATQFTVDGRELPKKRLAGFQKTRLLQPGATQHITLAVKIPDLAFWDGESARQVVYNGRYQFQVGPDSATTVGSATVGVRGTLSPQVRYVTVQPESVSYDAGDTIDLTGRNRWIKDDTDPARQPGRNLDVTADHVVEAVNNDGSFLDLKKAEVRYSSSDRSVATVSREGIVTATGNGVATINVTVGGVTGSAVITVHHPLALDSTPMLRAGETGTVTATYSNNGPAAIRDASVQLTVPTGWTVEAPSPTVFRSIAPGTSVTATWKVTVPTDSDPGGYSVSARATYRGARTNDSAQERMSVPYASASDARDNTAVSEDAQPTLANLDGAGRNVSQQALAAAGITSGHTVQHDGLTFDWPTTGTTAPDNIVAGGQTIPLTGSGTKLGFLATATNGTAADTATVTYSDGTTQEFPLAFADWWKNAPAPGSDILATLPYINTSSGRANRDVSLYAAVVTLWEDKTPSYLTLPNISNGTVRGQNALHIFAIALG